MDNEELMGTDRKDKEDDGDKGDHVIMVRFDSAYFASNVGSDVLRSL